MMQEYDGKIMSHAEKRRARKPQITVTTAMKEEARADLVQLRRYQRMVKSNGGRGKVKAFHKKRDREDDSDDDGDNFFEKKQSRAIDQDAKPLKRVRREEAAPAPAEGVAVPATSAPRAKKATTGRKTSFAKNSKPITNSGNAW